VTTVMVLQSASVKSTTRWMHVYGSKLIRSRSQLTAGALTRSSQENPAFTKCSIAVTNGIPTDTFLATTA
jgi:hypothetical protein